MGCISLVMQMHSTIGALDDNRDGTGVRYMGNGAAWPVFLSLLLMIPVMGAIAHHATYVLTANQQRR